MNKSENNTPTHARVSAGKRVFWSRGDSDSNRYIAVEPRALTEAQRQILEACPIGQHGWWTDDAGGSKGGEYKSFLYYDPFAFPAGDAWSPENLVTLFPGVDETMAGLAALLDARPEALARHYAGRRLRSKEHRQIGTVFEFKGLTYRVSGPSGRTLMPGKNHWSAPIEVVPEGTPSTPRAGKEVARFRLHSMPKRAVYLFPPGTGEPPEIVIYDDGTEDGLDNLHGWDISPADKLQLMAWARRCDHDMWILN